MYKRQIRITGAGDLEHLSALSDCAETLPESGASRRCDPYHIASDGSLENLDARSFIRGDMIRITDAGDLEHLSALSDCVCYFNYYEEPASMFVS